MKEIMLDGNRSLQQFLKRQRVAPDYFLKHVTVRYHDILRFHPDKIKPVGKARHRKQLLFEFKLPFDGMRTFRVAYVERDNQLLVLYASTTLLKKDFVREVMKTALVD